MAIGFRVERLRFGEVENFWARRGKHSPLLAFAGHTDVVPPGPEQEWTSDPFVPNLRDGLLFGRGAADMKGSLAAMIVACERFVHDQPDHRGSIGFLITSDEEGAARDGTRRVIEHLQLHDVRIDWCLVGEPSSIQKLGDTAKNGRRGSLHGLLTLRGTQGHVAYPQLAENPIHGIGSLVTELAESHWDAGNAFFPPTSFQISNIRGGTGATNVIPGEVELVFNFRFGTESSVDDLKHRVRQMIDTHLLNQEVKAQRRLHYDLEWNLSGYPFLTPEGELVEAAAAAIADRLGLTVELSTAGGTSDGRFIAPTGAQVLELGPVNASIHKVDEHVRVDDLERLTDVYEGILRRLLIRIIR